MRIGIIGWVGLLAFGTGCRAQALQVPPPPVSSPPSLVASPPGIPLDDLGAAWDRPLDQCLREHRALRGSACRGKLSVTVKKGERRLILSCDGEPVKSYLIALGRMPIGSKERRGDSRTPEGTYYLCNRVPRSAFYLSLRIAYPNAADAERGLRQGLINPHTYQQILNALRRHQKPPQNTALGGDICIHGGGVGTLVEQDGKRYVRVQDWTFGCVAMRNQDVRELHQRLPMGTPVTILP